MAIVKQKIGFNSKKVTLGDPERYSNSESHIQVNKESDALRPDKP